MSKQTRRKTSGKAAKGSKKEKGPKPELVVFAFRLLASDRTMIHKAAGPSKATRFVLSAALAAASGDTKAFEALAAQSKANLK